MSRRRPGVLCLVALAPITALLASACTGGANHAGPPTRTPSGTSGFTPVATSSGSVPNPFTIVATYSAASLGLKQPSDLAIAPNGNLYVTDSVRESVTEISPAADVIRRWGTKGTRPGQFSFHEGGAEPHAEIAVGPDGKVYVSDSGNGRVEVFSPAGTFIRQFGSFGSGPGHLAVPFGLAVDAAGDVYVADDQLETLSKFSSTGRFEWRIGGSSATDPDLRAHFQLSDAVDPQGTIVIAQDPTVEGSPLPGRVVFITASGRKVDAFGSAADFPAGSGACNVTLDRAGDEYVDSCGGGGNLEVFDRMHRLIGSWWASPCEISPRFDRTGEAFAIADDGSILKLRVALSGA